MKKMIWSILFLFVVMLGGSLHVEAAQLKQVPSGYTGIYTISDLDSIRNNLKGNYILMADIDMSEETAKGGSWDTGNGWNPIKDFAGVFDGNGHRIIGMNIYGYAGQGVGLFGNTQGRYYEKNVIIKNLGMVNVNIDVDFSKKVTTNDYEGYIGSIVGCGDGCTDIDGCYATGNIKTSSSSPYIGGLVGAYCGEIKNSYNEVKIDGGNITGGITGSGSSVGNCYNIGSIDCREITNIAWHGALVGSGDFLYGTVSYYQYGSASDAIGNKTYENYLRDRYNCLTETKMRMQNSYVGWDFDNVWYIDPYCSYPYPQLINCPAVRVESLELIALPSKTIYQQGESLDLDGAKLKITYEDGVSALIPLDYKMLSGYDMNAIGHQTVIVTYGGVKTSYGIEVKEVPVQEVVINVPTTTLYRGETIQLQAVVSPINASNPSITWSSSNEAVATVDANGIVAAKSKGTVVISAVAGNGITASCNLSVFVRTVALQLSQNQIDMHIGDVMALSVAAIPLDATDIIYWKSSNDKVVSVIDGTLYANHEGNAIVSAYTGTGVSAECNVSVWNTQKQGSTPTVVTRAKIKSLKNKSGKKLVLLIVPDQNASKYEVQYSTKKNFVKYTKKETSSTKISIKNLNKGKKYFVRVRSIYQQNGKKVYGNWSKVKKIKIIK